MIDQFLNYKIKSMVDASNDGNTSCKFANIEQDKKMGIIRILDEFKNEHQCDNHSKDFLAFPKSTSNTGYTISRIISNGKEISSIQEKFQVLTSKVRRIPEINMEIPIDSQDSEKNCTTFFYNDKYYPLTCEHSNQIKFSIEDLIQINDLKRAFLHDIAQLILEICTADSNFIFEINDLVYDTFNHQIALILHQNILDLNKENHKKDSRLQADYMALLLFSAFLLILKGLEWLNLHYKSVKDEAKIEVQIFDPIQEILKEKNDDFYKVILKETLDVVQPFIKGTRIFLFLLDLVKINYMSSKSSIQSIPKVLSPKESEIFNSRIEHSLTGLNISFINIQKLLLRNKEFNDPRLKKLIENTFKSLVRGLEKQLQDLNNPEDLVYIMEKQLRENEMNGGRKSKENDNHFFGGLFQKSEDLIILMNHLGGKNNYTSSLIEQLFNMKIEDKNDNDEAESQKFNERNSDYGDLKALLQGGQYKEESKLFKSQNFAHNRKASSPDILLNNGIGQNYFKRTSAVTNILLQKAPNMELTKKLINENENKNKNKNLVINHANNRKKHNFPNVSQNLVYPDLKYKEDTEAKNFGPQSSISSIEQDSEDRKNNTNESKQEATINKINQNEENPDFQALNNPYQIFEESQVRSFIEFEEKTIEKMPNLMKDLEKPNQDVKNEESKLLNLLSLNSTNENKGIGINGLDTIKRVYKDLNKKYNNELLVLMNVTTKKKELKENAKKDHQLIQALENDLRNVKLENANLKKCKEEESKLHSKLKEMTDKNCALNEEINNLNQIIVQIQTMAKANEKDLTQKLLIAVGPFLTKMINKRKAKEKEMENIFEAVGQCINSKKKPGKCKQNQPNKIFKSSPGQESDSFPIRNPQNLPETPRSKINNKGKRDYKEVTPYSIYSQVSVNRESILIQNSPIQGPKNPKQKKFQNHRTKSL